MRYLGIAVLSLAIALSTPIRSGALTNEECNETEEGAYLCGDDCFIYRENSNCIYLAVYIECWWDDEWVQSFYCRSTPCFI